LIPLLADARCDFDSLEMFAKEEVFDVRFVFFKPSSIEPMEDASLI
jgi:hypothetical protein